MGKILEQGSEKRPLVISGPLSYLTGYGVHTMNMAVALSKYTKLFVHQWPSKSSIAHEVVVEMIDKHIELMPFSLPRTVPTVKIWHEHDLLDFPTDRRIAFPVWERDLIPKDSTDSLNRCDLVFVPSKWQAQSFVSSGGQEGIVRVIPEGVDTSLFTPNGIKYTDNRPVRFIHVGKCELRKSTALIAKAFGEALQGKNAVLDMYVRNPFLGRHNLSGYGLSLVPNVNYKIDDCIYDKRKMAQLLHQYDGAVYASKAEGWQLPVLEAMASGLLTISTNVTGLSEYVTDKNALVVECKGMERAHDGVFFNATQNIFWAKVEYESLVENIRTAYDMIIGQKQGPLVENAIKTANTFSWDEAAKKAVNALDQGELWK